MDPRLPPQLPPALPSRTSGLSIASLVLAIVGLGCGPAAIPAVICGHWSLSRIEKSAGSLGGRGLGIAGLVIGYMGVALFSLVVIVSVTTAGSMRSVDKPFAIEKVAVPAFPELPAFASIAGSSVRVAQFELTSKAAGGREWPGSRMQMRVYLPPGEHALHSLSCVLVAPAGTNLLCGSSLDPLDQDAYHREALPYAEAGMAVVLYSLDGELKESSDKLDEAKINEVKAAYTQFNNACAGIVNGRNALEFARQRLTMVDPSRIYSAGHSSAGTASLLLAAHEPRLRGCLAYAPEVDVESRLKDIASDISARLVFPGMRSFLKRSSPSTHVDRIKIPVFLFHARDDENVPAASIVTFAEKLKATNPVVKLVTVESGGHYESMIEEGIPSGIRWIREMSDSAVSEAAR